MRIATFLLAASLVSITMPGVASGANYKLDSDHTYPSLEFSHMGVSVWRGKFDRTTGTATLDRVARTGTVSVRVETNSIDFGLASMHEFAIRPDWLDVSKYPVMAYEGSLVFDGDRPVAVDGQLTLRGTTKPLKLTINSFTCMEHPFYKKEVCGADAEGQLNRADFGMTQFAEGDAGKVRLRIQVEALKED